MKDKILTIFFILFLGVMFFLNIYTPDKDISLTERRKLTRFPDLNIENIMDGTFFSSFDQYASDQIINRDNFRSIKANFSYKVLHNLDNNNLFVINDNIFKLEYPLNQKNLNININKLNNLANKYLNNMNIYYTIVPDKNYYLLDDKYLKLDYDYLFKTMNSNLSSFKYIDITPDLNINSYYYTDPHWRQKKLYGVVSTLINNMGLIYRDTTYNENILFNFYGSYYGQLGLKEKPESLSYLTNDIINNVSVYYLENDKLNKIYNIDKYTSMDPYNIYLDGASALIRITNDKSYYDKDLIVFRDSFGSSLIPLLVPYYNKITIIDLRYLSSNLLSNYVSFNNQDVLFIYSTLILNTNILK